jgi:hypothetical protein
MEQVIQNVYFDCVIEIDDIVHDTVALVKN